MVSQALSVCIADIVDKLYIVYVGSQCVNWCQDMKICETFLLQLRNSEAENVLGSHLQNVELRNQTKSIAEGLRATW